MSHIRRYLLSGLLFWIPIWVTLLVLHFIVQILDGSLALLPKDFQPQSLFGQNIPGIGVILSILIVFFTGMLVSNILGKKLVTIGESILNRIPLVRSVYTATKQVIETLFSSGSQSFRKVILLEYPRKNCWSIGFQTSTGVKEIAEKTGEDVITVFVPTTPNPTSGFLLVVPKKDVFELEMSVDQALKLVISLGVVAPNGDSK